MNSTNPKLKFGILILTTVVLFVALLALAYINLTGQGNSVNKDPYADYTKINQLIPGQTTEAEALKMLGKPASQSNDGETKTIVFSTPFSDYKNTVVFENGIVLYAIENVFGSYRGTFEDFQEEYGQPSATYSQEYDEGMWYVFLDKGVAVNVIGSIREILYFKPQDEATFYSNFKDLLGLTREADEHHSHVDEDYAPEGFTPEDPTPAP